MKKTQRIKTYLKQMNKQGNPILTTKTQLSAEERIAQIIDAAPVMYTPQQINWNDYMIIPKHMRGIDKQFPFTKKREFLENAMEELYASITPDVIFDLLYQKNEKDTITNLNNIYNKHQQTIEQIYHCSHTKVTDIHIPSDRYVLIDDLQLTHYLSIFDTAPKGRSFTWEHREDMDKDTINFIERIDLYLSDLIGLIINLWPSLLTCDQHAQQTNMQYKQLTKNQTNLSPKTKDFVHLVYSDIPHKIAQHDIILTHVLEPIMSDYRLPKKVKRVLKSEDISIFNLGAFIGTYMILIMYYVDIMMITPMYISVVFPEYVTTNILNDMLLSRGLNQYELEDTYSKILNYPKDAPSLCAFLNPTTGTEDEQYTNDILVNGLILKPLSMMGIDSLNLFTQTTMDKDTINRMTVSPGVEGIGKSLIKRLKNMKNEDMFKSYQYLVSRLMVLYSALNQQQTDAKQAMHEALTEVKTLQAKDQSINDERLAHLQQQLTEMTTENERLQAIIETKDTQYNQLSKLLAPYENLKIKAQELQDELEMQQNMTDTMMDTIEQLGSDNSEDTTESDYDEEQFIRSLQEKSIFIVGGHEHWRASMKNVLPLAKILAAESVNTSVKSASSADIIIINTGMMNHPMFHKVRDEYYKNKDGKLIYINSQASNISLTLHHLYQNLK